MVFLHRCWLLLALSLVCTTLASSSAPAPGIFEIDLIFPHNKTYAPSTVFPYIFAIQNPNLVGGLDASLSWTIEQQGVSLNESVLARGLKHLNTINYSNSDPYFVWGSSTKFNTEGTYSLYWEVDVSNCSQVSEVDKLYCELYQGPRGRTLYFTTKNSSLLQPDLVAATNNDNCHQSQGFAYNVTQLLEAPATSSYGGDYRAQFAPEVPPPTPCKVQIDQPAAASFSAAMTSTACFWSRDDEELNLNCPTPTPNHAAPVLVQSLLAGGLWLSSLSGLLAYNLV